MQPGVCWSETYIVFMNVGVNVYMQVVIFTFILCISMGSWPEIKES